MTTPTDIRNNAIREAESTLTDMGENVANLGAMIRRYGDAVYMLAHTRGMWELEGMPVHAVGSAGQLMAHPMLRTIERQEAHADALARSLNLTPESRSRRRIGAPMGSSTASDRRGPTRLRKAA